MATENAEALQSKSYSFEAEQAVLGCILIRPEAFSTGALAGKNAAETALRRKDY